MKRFRVFNDLGLDTWVCEECLENMAGSKQLQIIDVDNDEYEDGCNECGCCHSAQLDSED